MNTEYYRLLVDTDRRDLMRIRDYDLGDFYSPSFWLGKPLAGKEEQASLSRVRLYTAKAESGGDYVSNPLGWPICSERLLKIMQTVAPGDFEAFDAPLWKNKGTSKVAGYKILNITTLLNCIDLTKSNVSYDDEDETEIAAIYDFALQGAAIPANVHLFRATEWTFSIFASPVLAKAVTDGGITGLAFEKCGVA